MATPRDRLVGAVVSVAALAGLPACMPGVPAGDAAAVTPAVSSISAPPTALTTTPAPATLTAQTTTPPPAWRRTLAASFAHLQPRLHARSVGVALVVVGRTDPLILGTWRSGPAWSTIKVPLSLAASQHVDSASTRQLIHRAITRSDNAAAEALWARLGSGRRAASEVDAVLRADGDGRTRTQWRQVRPPFTPFGQTTWSLAEQLAFTRHLACDRHAASVRTQMSAVVAAQRWGLGRLSHARIKGGWGPDPHGRYLVRQLALVPRGHDLVAVVVAVQPSNGTFAQGTRALDVVAAWLRASLPSLPSVAHTC